MEDYTIIGIDLAKTKFHIAALNQENKVVMKKAIRRDDFISRLGELFSSKQTFAFEACGGAHNIGQILTKAGHNVIILKPKDVKAYAKSRQKNDINDAISICKAALDPDLKRVHLKSEEEQTVSYIHKSRQNVIQQRIQISNSIMTSLHEFGFVVVCGKAKFAKECKEHVMQAYEDGHIDCDVKREMLKDCDAIARFMNREKELDQMILARNKKSEKACLLKTIAGIGPINASILSIKEMDSYETARDFAASLGLVPKQSTTGGNIKLGGITKQGDRYSRGMLIQAGRSIVMRSCKTSTPSDELYQFVERLKQKGKKFNVICVAVANKLARIAYACVTKEIRYQEHKYS
ncbi:MAG TPA: IS110 family transposase [Candidatus Megaira endosymbiont of Nemacystus decipiens]|nr:IS110 family transposase [Candidatus Megaera endosymbiont of Nemacystus decipiens]